MLIAACCVMRRQDSNRSRVKAAGTLGCSRYSTLMSVPRNTSGRHRMLFVRCARMHGSDANTRSVDASARITDLHEWSTKFKMEHG